MEIIRKADGSLENRICEQPVTEEAVIDAFDGLSLYGSLTDIYFGTDTGSKNIEEAKEVADFFALYNAIEHPSRELKKYILGGLADIVAGFAGCRSTTSESQEDQDADFVEKFEKRLEQWVQKLAINEEWQPLAEALAEEYSVAKGEVLPAQKLYALAFILTYAASEEKTQFPKRHFELGIQLLQSISSLHAESFIFAALDALIESTGVVSISNETGIVELLLKFGGPDRETLRAISEIISLSDSALLRFRLFEIFINEISFINPLKALEASAAIVKKLNAEETYCLMTVLLARVASREAEQKASLYACMYLGLLLSNTVKFDKGQFIISNQGCLQEFFRKLPQDIPQLTSPWEAMLFPTENAEFHSMLINMLFILKYLSTPVYDRLYTLLLEQSRLILEKDNEYYMKHCFTTVVEYLPAELDESGKEQLKGLADAIIEKRAEQLYYLCMHVVPSESIGNLLSHDIAPFLKQVSPTANWHHIIARLAPYISKQRLFFIYLLRVYKGVLNEHMQKADLLALTGAVALNTFRLLIEDKTEITANESGETPTEGLNEEQATELLKVFISQLLECFLCRDEIKAANFRCAPSGILAEYATVIELFGICTEKITIDLGTKLDLTQKLVKVLVDSVVPLLGDQDASLSIALQSYACISRLFIKIVGERKYFQMLYECNNLPAAVEIYRSLLCVEADSNEQQAAAARYANYSNLITKLTPQELALEFAEIYPAFAANPAHQPLLEVFFNSLLARPYEDVKKCVRLLLKQRAQKKVKEAGLNGLINEYQTSLLDSFSGEKKAALQMLISCLSDEGIYYCRLFCNYSRFFSAAAATREELQLVLLQNGENTVEEKEGETTVLDETLLFDELMCIILSNTQQIAYEHISPYLILLGDGTVCKRVAPLIGVAEVSLRRKLYFAILDAFMTAIIDKKISFHSLREILIGLFRKIPNCTMADFAAKYRSYTSRSKQLVCMHCALLWLTEAPLSPANFNNALALYVDLGTSIGFHDFVTHLGAWAERYEIPAAVSIACTHALLELASNESYINCHDLNYLIKMVLKSTDLEKYKNQIIDILNKPPLIRNAKKALNYSDLPKKAAQLADFYLGHGIVQTLFDLEKLLDIQFARAYLKRLYQLLKKEELQVINVSVKHRLQMLSGYLERF